ncbi:MAG: ATP-binding protein [Thermodesulfobacteriota bacterium]|nr:ATP-binding protein [Thermodesulfobacteriota bacterium]
MNSGREWQIIMQPGVIVPGNKKKGQGPEGTVNSLQLTPTSRDSGNRKPETGNRRDGTQAEKLPSLQQPFEDFDRATVRLQKTFADLEGKFENINRELDRKNIELQETLVEKERISSYLQNILESLTTGVVVMDMEGKTTMMNQCAETFTGFSREDTVGVNANLLFENKISSDSEGRFALKHFDSGLGEKIKLKERILEIFGSSVKAKNGEETGKVIVLRDITRLEKLEEMVKRTEKLAVMGETAANIAHEIRNPLGSIELFASLLIKDLKDKKNRDRASHIVSSVRDMDNKISNLLLFARDQKPPMKKVNVHNALKEIIVFSEQIIGKENIICSVNYCENADPVIAGNAEMLKQVFLNLMLNAMQSMSEGGNLYVETRISGGNDKKKNFHNSNIEISFMDTGCGISTENIKKIFDPFFTTKGTGAGLGLAIVHNIVDIHGGSIDVENNKSGGATFNITFPVINQVDRPKATN